jgi:hypothetical protein
MLLILLILVLVLCLGGGFWGYRGGYVGYNPLGLVLLIVVILVVVGLFTSFPYRHW